MFETVVRQDWLKWPKWFSKADQYESCASDEPEKNQMQDEKKKSDPYWRRLIFLFLSVLGLFTLFGIMLMLGDGKETGMKDYRLAADFPMLSIEWTPHPEFGAESNPESDDVFYAQIPNKNFEIELDRTDASLAGLGEGLPSHNDSTAIYSVSWTHQLHCLGLIKDAMWDLLRSRHEILSPIPENRDMTDGLHHINHCFDYLHQSITCCADMTIESRALDNKTEPHINGYGSVHKCKNLEAVSHWLEYYQPK